MSMSLVAARSRLHETIGVLGGEGLRLFFPLAALHAALWPLLWSVVYGLDLPFSSVLSPGLWHANEMIVGTFGAALIGFITTAIPEWSDTQRIQGRQLYALAGMWGGARIVGLLGGDGLLVVAALGDISWSLILAFYGVRVSWAKRSTPLAGFALWLAALAAAIIVIRFAFLTGDAALAEKGLHVAGLVMMGLLGLALSRIAVPVINLVLDPSETSSPFRPHPGRLNLAPGLVAVAIAGELAGLSPAIRAYLLIAAGAAFLDRVADAFVGREAARAEILVLSASSLFAGVGLILVGASWLGAPFAAVPAWHLALMGGLGLGVLAVFAIAGLMHTGRPLGIPLPARLAFILAGGAALLRALPELGLMPFPPGPPYALPALLWAAAFGLWLWTYWPYLSDPKLAGPRKC